jgi:hypothetical protein
MIAATPSASRGRKRPPRGGGVNATPAGADAPGLALTLRTNFNTSKFDRVLPPIHQRQKTRTEKTGRSRTSFSTRGCTPAVAGLLISFRMGLPPPAGLRSVRRDVPRAPPITAGRGFVQIAAPANRGPSPARRTAEVRYSPHGLAHTPAHAPPSCADAGSGTPPGSSVEDAIPTWGQAASICETSLVRAKGLYAPAPPARSKATSLAAPAAAATGTMLAAQSRPASRGCQQVHPL